MVAYADFLYGLAAGGSVIFFVESEGNTRNPGGQVLSKKCMDTLLVLENKLRWM